MTPKTKLFQIGVTEDGTITPDKSVILEEGKDYTLEVTTDNETGQQKIVVKMAHIEAPYFLSHMYKWHFDIFSNMLSWPFEEFLG